MIGKKLFCKNKHHIGAVHVLSFHLSARSSSFFRAFFLHFYGKPFYESPDIKKPEKKVRTMTGQVMAVVVIKKR